MALVRRTLPRNEREKVYYELKDENTSESVGYWRKANAIHGWFVDNVQSGNDDCGEYEVSKEQLITLLEECNKVLTKQELAGDILPTRSGFFFGDADYDSYYYDQLRDTVTIIEKILQSTDWEVQAIYYSSSW